jgi:hypothetical protein
MMKHITALLVSLSIAAPAVLPAQPAFAAPAAQPGAAAERAVSGATHGARVIKAGDRHWRDGDHRRWERRAHRRDSRHDGRRADRWRDDRRRGYYGHGYRYRDHRRYDDRRYGYRGHGHHHRDGRRHRDNDAAYILGGIALGSILLYSIFEHGNRRDREHRR